MQFILRQYPAISGSVIRVSAPWFAQRRLIYLGEHFTQGPLSEIQLKSPVILAGRNDLPSSEFPEFPKFLSGPRQDFPLLVKAKSDPSVGLLEWAKRSREVIGEANRRFEQDGTAVAILFRGLPIKSMMDYSEWVNNLGYKPFPYKAGGLVREDLAPNVAEGAVIRKEASIILHNELAYAAEFPKIFSIYYSKKSRSGGETCIADVRETLSKLDRNFVEKCATKGIRYMHFLYDKSSTGEFVYKSWQEQFITDEPSEVERYLTDHGFHFEWKDKNLFYWLDKSPFITDPRNGEQLWFNSLQIAHHSAFKIVYSGKFPPENKASMSCRFGDGEAIEQNDMDKLQAILWGNAVAFDYQNGDVLFLDQLIVQHSRLSYEGEREVGVSLLTY